METGKVLTEHKIILNKEKTIVLVSEICCNGKILLNILFYRKSNKQITKKIDKLL